MHGQVYVYNTKYCMRLNFRRTKLLKFSRFSCPFANVLQNISSKCCKTDSAKA